MRSAFACALILVAACGDNNGAKSDAGNHHADSGSNVGIDAKVFLDAAPPMFVDGTIADLRAAADGAVAIKVSGVIVTYIKPQVGDPASDPAGFTIQKDPTGPAIFVALDPSMLAIPLVVGDVADISVTMKTTVSGQPRVTAIAALTRISQGADLTALTQDLSAATDTVSAAASYDSELVSLTGTLTGTLGSSGTGFSRFTITTAGVPATPLAQVRAPTALMNAIDMTSGCSITLTKVPFSIFVTSGNTPVTNAEIVAFNTSEFTLTGCAAPVVSKVVALNAHTIRITFSRNIKASSLVPDGTQFTIAGLTVATGPVLAGRTITLTTTADMTPLTAYTVNIAGTLTDLQGTPLVAVGSNFLGFTTQATAVINEINGNIAGSCDMIELRVTSDGSLGNFRLTERDGSSINYTIPAALQVHKNDFVLVHFSGAAAACNPAPAAVDELTDIAGQTKALHAKNFDTAFDLYAPTGGLTNSTNVYTLYDINDNIVDAVFGSDALTTDVAAATLSQAAIVGTAVQWEPHMTSYTSAQFRAAAITDITTSGNSLTGNSIQRLTNTDTNASTDWTPGTGAAPTWGAANAGQTPL